ncbi:MAG TPA: hypothetical protein VFQ74_08060 [Pseudolysinimonas sp.]|nr:hypothetical protein [Pseudolysinimonas sp.]
MARTTRAGRYVIRSASVVIPFWMGIAVLAVVVGTPLVRADWQLFGFAAGPALLLAWILWFVLYRPAVHYDGTRAVIINFGRVHVLPWSRVTSVRQGISLIFDLDSGKPVSAFGAPAPRRTGNVAGNFDRRTRPVETFHRDAELLDGFRRSAPPDPTPVTVHWDVIPLAIGVALLIAVAIEVSIGM